MKINSDIFKHLNDTITGRIRLKIFKEITNKTGEIPTKKETIEYLKEIDKTHNSIAFLLGFIITDGKYKFLEYKKLKKVNSIENLFQNLDQFSLVEPVLLVLKKALNNKDICVWIKRETLQNDLGLFYTIILFDEQSFPKKIFSSLEIRVSRIEPEPCVVINTTNEPIILSREDISKSKDEILNICLKALHYIAFVHIDSVVPLQKAKTLNKLKVNPNIKFPIDESLIELLQELRDGKIKCTIATVNIDQIIPFSYDFCFELPIYMIELAEKNIERIIENGILLYWNNEHFVMNDDYIAYLALRKLGYKTVKAAILGDYPNDLQIIKCGGFELLPSLMPTQVRKYDSLPMPIKKNELTKYLKKLSTMSRVRNLSQCKCVVFSEDTNTVMLENILIASGFDIDETIIYSYKNCTNLNAIGFNVNSIREINPDIKIIVHRDRDYMLDEEIKKIENIIVELGAVPFITIGTDIESYYLNVNHINSLYKDLSIKRLEEIRDDVFEKLKDESIQKIKKHEHGEKHNSKSTYLDLFLNNHYENNKQRFVFGKKALGNLISILQSELKINPDIIKSSKYLKDETLSNISKQIWS